MGEMIVYCQNGHLSVRRAFCLTSVLESDNDVCYSYVLCYEVRIASISVLPKRSTLLTASAK